MTALQQPHTRNDAHITCHVIGRRTVLDVAGEVDLAMAPALAAAIDDALSAGAAELWIDLSATTFMDSSGLHVLLDTRLRSGELNRRLAVICRGGAVRRLFEVAGVLDQLPLFDNRGAAHRAA